MLDTLPEDEWVKPEGFWTNQRLELEEALKRILNIPSFPQEGKLLRILGQLSAYGYDKRGLRGIIEKMHINLHMKDDMVAY